MVILTEDIEGMKGSDTLDAHGPFPKFRWPVLIDNVIPF